MMEYDGLSDSTGICCVDEEDRLHEECGVFGVFNHSDAAALTALGLHALQHRGQEAAGIVTFNGKQFNAERRLGLVGDHFSKQGTMDRLHGHASIGHVRYSTTGGTILRNVQPLFADLAGGGFAVCHNGNLTNALTLRQQLIQTGRSVSQPPIRKSFCIWSHKAGVRGWLKNSSTRCGQSRAPIHWWRFPTRS